PVIHRPRQLRPRRLDGLDLGHVLTRHQCIFLDRELHRTIYSPPLGGSTVLARDAFGRPIALTDPLGAVTRMEWSPEGKPVRRTDPLGHVESWKWDAEGNCLTHTDENGGTTAWSYGPFDLPVSQTGPDGARYVFTRDTELNITAVTAPDGRTWTYTLDAAGRTVAETDYDGRTTTREYDPAGHLVRQTNPAGQSIDYAHDVLGRLTSTTTDTGETTTWTHDAAGRLVSATSPGVELSRTHDPAGNLLSETVNGHTLTLTVDPVGHLLSRTTPTGHTSRWTYDTAGRPIGLETAGRHLNFHRDAAGQETERRIGNVLTLTTGHDPGGRTVEQALTGAGGRRLHHKRWTYRTDGYPTAVTDDSGTTTLALDPIGRPTAVSGSAGTESYAYNPTGDQTSAKAPGLPAEAAGDRAYTGTLLARAGRTRYAYDAAGRVIRRTVTRISRTPDVWHYTWDAHDRLTKTVTPDGTVWTYTYDAFGRRIAKHRHHPDGRIAETVRFTWHDTTLVEEHHTVHEGAAPVTVTTWDHTGLHPLTQTTRSFPGDADQDEIDRRFAAIVTDLVGTPTHLTNSDTDELTPLTTTLWGHSPGVAPTPLRFPGQYADEETGWHYNLHRHYDPT
ncbi:type IV secretion protein Rhs, partial [Streptomyces alkaliphilus]|nr:type IV secretion protein Rhs [Streptomyces alkaliphilus]